MKKGLALFGLLLLLLPACTAASLEGHEEEDGPPSFPAARVSPEDATPTAPRSTGKEIPCTYFVSPAGDDSAPGSKPQPWRSFQHSADSAQPGETVCFREGTYVVEESVHVTGSGTAEAPIVFIAYLGERPILDGGGEVGDLLTLDRLASYVRISGFTLRNFKLWGIDLRGENRFVHLDHLKVEGGEAGVHFTSGEDDLGPPEAGPVEHITLEDSLILNSEYTGVDCTPGPCNDMIFRRMEVYGSGLAGEDSFGADGIAISRGYPILVEECYIHDNGGDGIDLGSRNLEGHATGVIVRRNRVERNHQNGIKLWAGGRIENNVVWGQGNSALWLGTFDSELEVVNNTVAFNMWDPIYSGRNWAFAAGYPEEVQDPPQVKLLLVNNIFAYNTGPDVGDPTGIYLGPGVRITEHSNIYHSNPEGEIAAEFIERDITRQELVGGAWAELTRQGQNNLGDDPLFLSGWPQVDLQLEPGSPAIDAGDDDFCPEDDHLGQFRPVDGNHDGEAICDIGAFEWTEQSTLLMR